MDENVIEQTEMPIDNQIIMQNPAPQMAPDNVAAPPPPNILIVLLVTIVLSFIAGLGLAFALTIVPNVIFSFPLCLKTSIGLFVLVIIRNLLAIRF